MKISIRFSVLGVMIGLLLSLAALIFGINYFTINDLLIKFTENSLYHTSGKVSEQVSKYLQPLNNYADVSGILLDRKVIIPENSTTFTNFLYSFVLNDPNIMSAYWGDQHGNFYFLRENDDKTFYGENILVNAAGEATGIENFYDDKFSIIKTSTTTTPSYDPRLRPWYQLAILEKKSTWAVYPLLKGNKKRQLGITSARPVYDNAGNLLGVFGVDIPLSMVSNFVNNLKITEHSVVLICDDSGHLISAYMAKTNLLEENRMATLDNLQLPWVQASFNIYQKDQKNIFEYIFDGKKYIAAYEQIPNIRGMNKWFVAIVMPMQDAVAPLIRSIIYSFLAILAAIIICILIAAGVSSRISNPIIKLTQDSELICQLRLGEVKMLVSRIKEIANMSEAFMKMKSTLQSFTRYLPVTLVKNLISSGKIVGVGGEIKELTLLFSDIEGFTPIAEVMPPEKLMRFLSDYFQAATSVIISLKGTVDKYIGDGMMAFWGAPLDDAGHAFHACLAAVKLQDAFAKFNAKSRSEGLPEARTRIGISTGETVVGNVGSDDRLSYTSLGDPVNLASRLEGLNKLYGTYTMVSEFTYKLVKDKFRFRLLDKVAVKGKQQGICIYELLGEIGTKLDQPTEKYDQDFSQAFANYEQGLWQSALDLFNEMAKKYPNDKLIKIFIDRCTQFLQNPPQNWNGIWKIIK